MATEYGNPKFRDSNKNLPFTMNGQPGNDALARVVNTVSANNITISNLKFSSNSDYSKTHNNSVNYDIVINSTSKTYRIDWKLKSNVGTHPGKTTSLNYGLSSWFNGGTDGKANNPVTYTSTIHQLKGTNNFSSFRSLADLRYFDAKIRVNGLDGDSNKEVVFNTASSFAGDNKQIKGVAQGSYNYDAPYTVFKATTAYTDKNGNLSYYNWINFQTKDGGINKEISITSSSGDISTGDNAHYLIISDNSPSVLYGDISGTHTVHYNIDKDANGNSISNTHAGTVTFTSDNNGKAFVTTNTDKSNSTSYSRSATIAYSLTDYNTSSSSSSSYSGKIEGSFTIYQAGGNIPPKDPELTYSWKITSGSEYVSGTKIVSTPVNAKLDNDSYRQYSYQNKYIITVKDNSGTIGSITGTPSISSINNPKPLYKIGTFNISGLSMTPAVNTNNRSITVNTTVSGNDCTNFNVSNTSIDTTVTQTGSNWVQYPDVVGKLSVICENPQTDKIDQSNPASFEIRQLSSSNDYSTSLSNVILSEGNNEFGYRFGTISASSTNIKVSGNIKVTEPSNKIFPYRGGSVNVTMYPESLTFDAGYSKKVDDIRWKLKFTPDTIQNSKQITNVKSKEITVTQSGIPEGSEKTYNPLTITGNSSSNWLTVGNTCTFNYNDYNNYTSSKPNKMTLNADPNRTSVNEITVTDTNSSNVYKVQITDVDESTSKTASLTLSSSDSNTTLDKTTISDFIQYGENINCNISLSYSNSTDSDNKYVNLKGTSLSISDTNEHNLSISRGTTGHTNNTLTGLSATKSGDNDSLTISTSDGNPLWWKPNSSTFVGLNISASGTNLGNYTLSKSSITVSIPGDSQQTPWVKWYSKAEGGSWTKISDEASRLTILQSGSAASAGSSSPSLTKRGDSYGLTDKPFKLTRGQPSSAATKVYYKVESSAGNAGTDDSVYIERTAGSTGFGQVSVTASSTNIPITADSSISVGEGDLKVAGSNENTEYANWYVYGPAVTLGTPAITTEAGLSKITERYVSASKAGATVPASISAFAETKDKEFKISVSVSPSVTAKWEASVSAGGLTSSDSGTFDTSKYGSSNIYSSITYKWDTNETTSEITWKPDVHVAKEDYEKSISCKVTVLYQDGTEKSDTLTWKTKVLATSVKFEGTLSCSNDKTITAFDSPQTYDTTATASGYKVTATSGTLTQDWTATYPPVLNATEHTLTAVQGSTGSTTGSTSFEYTLKSPSISNVNVTNTLDLRQTVQLHCYGKSVQFEGKLVCSEDKTITAFDPQTYYTTATASGYKVTAISGSSTQDWTATYPPVLNATEHTLTAVQGSTGSTTGSTSFEYTLKSPSMSNVDVTNTLDLRHIVQLHCYGKSVQFEGKLVCSENKTITAFDSPQTYYTTATASGYKVTATSGSSTQDWTSSYKPIQNATSKTLTAVQGSSGSTKGDASFEYTLKSPSISNVDVTNTLDIRQTVHLYCYGKSVQFEGKLVCSEDKTITAFDPQTYDTTATASGYKVTATSGSSTQDWTSSYKPIQNATSKTLTAVQGSTGSTKGVASFEYTLKSPSISNVDVTNTLDIRQTVHLYCYGKSYYNG